MDKFFSKYNKDHYGGALMILIGLGAVVVGRTYKIGTLSAMGSGFFPVALGVILILTGLAIAFSSGGKPTAGQAAQPVDLRGPLCIVLGIVAFIVLGVYGGLLPATFAIVFISALGDRDNTWKSALALALAMLAVCVIVFWWALNLQFSLFQWG
jgi:hypothetical protein